MERILKMILYFLSRNEKKWFPRNRTYTFVVFILKKEEVSNFEHYCLELNDCFLNNLQFVFHGETRQLKAGNVFINKSRINCKW